MMKPAWHIPVAAALVLSGLSVSDGSDRASTAEFPSRWIYCMSGSVTPSRAKKYGESAAVICYAGVRINADGSLTLRESKGEIDALVATGRKVYPLVTPANKFSGETFLRNGEARAHAARSLARLCDERQFAGIHLDFEFLHPTCAPYYSEFAGEVRKALDGRDLTVAVFPREGFPRSWSGLYDLVKLSATDGVVIMCYDLHRKGTAPGPVTDAAWAEKNIIASLKSVPAEKLWLGVPLYGYVFDQNGGAEYVTMQKGISLLDRTRGSRLPGGVMRTWLKKSGVDCPVYVPDVMTIRILEKLAVQYHLAGVAYWRAGFEPDGFWDIRRFTR